MKRAGPLLKMTMALVALCGTLVLLADLFFGVFPDRAAQARELRKHMAESLAVQVAVLLQEDDRPALQRTLDHVAARQKDLRSLAIRRADGTLVLQAGPHEQAWRGNLGDTSRLEQVTVPLTSGGQRWGTFEMAFRAEPWAVAAQWLGEPLVVTLTFVGIVGSIVFALYLRRALQHLDPSSVIPERVQGAFDTMAEGVVVLDARGRVLLANRAFRTMHADTAQLRPGGALSSIAWLAAALPDDPGAHPWARAIGQRAPHVGQTLEVTEPGEAPRQLVISCAPIADAGGSVRGCLVTFNDVSALHRANVALRDTLAELSASKGEIERKNDELQRLATRDPLTGCLNRRAFLDALEQLSAQSDAPELGCVMIDIDHFKAVNDNHGHATGDRVIQEVAKKIQACARTSDLVCRYGGEEFCIVVPGADKQQVFAFAERVRARIEHELAGGLRDVPGLSVTVSAGVDSRSAQGRDLEALIDRADQALYRAKRGGRNRVCSYVGNVRAAAEPVAEERG